MAPPFTGRAPTPLELWRTHEQRKRLRSLTEEEAIPYCGELSLVTLVAWFFLCTCPWEFFFSFRFR